LSSGGHDFIAKSIFESALKFRAKPKQIWIPLPVLICHAAIVDLITQIESQRKIVIAQGVNAETGGVTPSDPGWRCSAEMTAALSGPRGDGRSGQSEAVEFSELAYVSLAVW